MLERIRWIPGAVLAALRLADVAAPPPAQLGVLDGALRPCALATNCVRSAPGGPPELAPIAYAGTRATTEAAVLAALAALGRTRVVERRGDYIRAESRSRVFRFVDDVEFLFDDASRAVHFRSASRVGRSDFGVNRRRVATLRRLVDARRDAAGPRRPGA